MPYDNSQDPPPTAMLGLPLLRYDFGTDLGRCRYLLYPIPVCNYGISPYARSIWQLSHC